jgi:hypothetical protein
MKIRESKNGYNTSTVVKGKRTFRTDVLMTTDNDICIFSSTEFIIPNFLKMKKEVHEYIQNIIGNDFQLIISWNYNNKNVRVL